MNAYFNISPQYKTFSKNLLQIFAIGDRKIFTAFKKADIPEHLGKIHLEKLIENNILIKEYSREKPIEKKHPKQKLKKNLRRYRIQHKIKFAKPFFRFWFRYCEPNIDLLEKKEFSKILKLIENDFENYVSFTYEELSNELIKHKFKDYEETGSYWDKNIELDILTTLKDGRVIVGECKWKNSKICKKTLTSLQKKCAVAGIEANYYALFSKSGFSNELLKNRDNNILLFDLDDLKEWAGAKPAYRKREKVPYSFEF
ncbi:DUF234 domain-containing protein [Nitrosophilus alvini]|uniref:DUF234 domain-containing protein n=1 Tax=Nitrosophilus alvini TaxID=2714855 RepID=UPI00190A1160|nr:DUF234 domain-containing protein [Nitrosophilus alvini]